MLKTLCEGCGQLFHPAYQSSHQRLCPEYIEVSKTFPYPCAQCGLGFKAPRGRANHMRCCTGSEPSVLHLCFCGQRVASNREHLPTCPGPKEIPIIKDENPPENGCACGGRFKTRMVASIHRPRCATWFVYQQRFTVRCEGCNYGFLSLNSKRAHTNICAPWQEWKAKKDKLERVYPCPSCGILMRGNTRGLHINVCKGSWTKEDWQHYSKLVRCRRFVLLEASKIAGFDYITCLICKERFRKFAYHMKHVHGISVREYKARYGGRTEASVVQLKAKFTFMSHFGVDHPKKDPVINAKYEDVRKATMRIKHNGAETNAEAGLCPIPKKTKPEEDVDWMTPDTVVYTGDHSYWVCCYDENHKWKNRNPDFVVYDEEQLALVREGKPVNEVRANRVIEVLGSYWHGEKMTGIPREPYEAQRVAEYATVGLKCLVIWESDLAKDMELVRSRLTAFIVQPMNASSGTVAKHALTEDLIVEAVRRYVAQHGRSPHHSKGDASSYIGITGETWRAIDAALRVGTRGLPGGSSLSKLLKARGFKRTSELRGSYKKT